MKNDIYKNGEKISKDLFWLTGDIRFYNMANGFKSLCKQKNA